MEKYLQKKEKVLEEIENIFEKVVQYRRHLHKNPELSYVEYETMKYISKQLTEIGIPQETGIAETGVVALIRGKHHTENQSCIGLRADIDALPITEENEIEYASQNEGIMHACGHDAHTSILLGAAEILWKLKDELEHPIKLIFQPGEERNPGGASLLVKAGVLENPKVLKMYGLHVDPDMTVGEIGTREGLFMASADEIYMDIHGVGGHGARPHEAVDSILIGAEIVTSLQKIVSRNCDPNIPSVLTFGHFEALGATNVIPAKAHLKGTFRTMNEEWREKALNLIVKQAELIAEANGGKVDVTISKGYPYLENDIITTREFITKAKNWLGNNKVHPELPKRMGAEDFSFYSQEIPTSFFRIGVKPEGEERIPGLHTSRFNLDEEALKTGMQMMVLAVL